MDIWLLMHGANAENKNPRRNKGESNEAATSFHHSSVLYTHTCLVPAAITDPIVRLFAKKSENPFWALKAYVTQTEDKELGAKVCIVEKYGSRIPELVKCLERCSERNYKRAGLYVSYFSLNKSNPFSINSCRYSVVIFENGLDVSRSRLLPALAHLLASLRLHIGDSPQS